jgi:hypothetical protein
MCACLGHAWSLSIPIQNLDEGACTILEISRADSDSDSEGTVLGWSYLKLSPDSTVFPVPRGVSRLGVLPGRAPVSLGAAAAPPGVAVDLPPLPVAGAGAGAAKSDLSLLIECSIQCV